MAAPLSTTAAATTAARTPTPVFGAAVRALAVPELLENILLQLHTAGANDNWTTGIVDLFVVQRVCKEFRDTTHASIHLRRAMRLEYDEENGTRKYGLQFLLDGDAGRLRQCRNFPSITMWSYTNDLYGNNQVLFDCKYDNAAISTAVIGDPASNEVSWYSSPAGPTGRTTPRRLVTLGKFFSKDASWRQMKLFGHPMQICIRLFMDMTMVNGDVREVRIWPVFVFNQPTHLLGLACTSLLAHVSRSRGRYKEFLGACENAQKRWYNAGREWSLGANLDHPVVRKHIKAVGKHNEAGYCGREKGSCAWCSASCWTMWTQHQADLEPMMDLMWAAYQEGLI